MITHCDEGERGRIVMAEVSWLSDHMGASERSADRGSVASTPARKGPAYACRFVTYVHQKKWPCRGQSKRMCENKERFA